MNTITINTGHPDAGLIYAEAYAAALAREDALREELALWKGRIVRRMGERTEFLSERDDARYERDALQQRLTVAEQLLQRVHQADALSHCCPLWKAIDAALKPAAEGKK